MVFLLDVELDPVVLLSIQTYPRLFLRQGWGFYSYVYEHSFSVLLNVGC